MSEPATDVDRFPRVSAYLRAMPDGIATCPEHLAKASSIRAGLRVLPLDPASLDGAPPRLRELVEYPLLDSMWITEVENCALSLLVADVYGLDRASFGRLSYDAMSGLVRSKLYSVMLRSVSAPMRLRTLAARWNTFHRGLALTATPTEGGLQLDLDFPPNLLPPLCVEGYTQVWQAVIDHSRSRGATARLVAAGDRSAQYHLDDFR